MTKRELADPSCLVFRVALAGNQGSSAYVTLADKSRLLIRDNTHAIRNAWQFEVVEYGRLEHIFNLFELQVRQTTFRQYNVDSRVCFCEQDFTDTAGNV